MSAALLQQNVPIKPFDVQAAPFWPFVMKTGNDAVTFIKKYLTALLNCSIEIASN